MSGWEAAVWIGAYGLIALVGLMLSAIFSGIETGLYTLNRVRLTVLAGGGDQRALRLRSELGNPNRLLSTVLIANNVANYVGSYGVAAILATIGLSSTHSVIINAAILVPMLFVFGETLPKDLFRTYTDHWSYTWSGFLVGCRRLLTWTGLLPVVLVMGSVLGRVLGVESVAFTPARMRISQLIKEGIGAGVLTEMQTTLADRALALRDRTVASAMVPWSNVVRLRVDADAAERRRVLGRQTPGHVIVVDLSGVPIGSVKVLDALLEPDRPLRDMMDEVTTLRPGLSLQQALRELRARRHVLAIVSDGPARPPIGLITAKDMVRPLTDAVA